MTSPEPVNIRAARPADAFQLALLLNSVQEPHFHTTAERLARKLDTDPSGYVVSETARGLSGVGTLWLPDFHPSHAWVGLNLHPDHRADGTAAALLDWLREQARAAGRPRLWTSVRADYLSAQPDLAGLGFREVHRTFGGGFYLSAWEGNGRSRREALAAQGYRLTPAALFREDPRLAELYALTRDEKVTAEPTIGPAADELTGEDALWEAAWLAWQGDALAGIALPERAGLGAWNAVLAVHPAHRRRGLASVLLAEVARSLQAEGVAFLNVAGSGRDAAYLGVLRRLGASIEPDWVAWERDA